MKRTIQPTLAGIALLVALGTPAALRAQGDRVFNLKGAVTIGTIKRMTSTEVEIDSRGRKVVTPVNEILKIRFEEDTGELGSARDRAFEGQYEDALRALRNINPDKFTRSVVAQDVKYLKAFCLAKLALQGQGDPAQAGTALFRFVRENPSNYRYLEANRMIGDLFVAMGRYDNAAQFYGVIAKAPWPAMQLEGAVLQADALRMKGDYAAALQGYQQADAATVNDPMAVQQKLLAQVGQAACLANTGKADQAIKIAEGIIAKNDPREQSLFGRAYNALGAAYLKAGRAEDALLAYLHTHLMFFQSPEVHAEALFHLIPLWEQQREPQRALEARQLLKQRYGGTVWAQRNQ